MKEGGEQVQHKVITTNMRDLSQNKWSIRNGKTHELQLSHVAKTHSESPKADVNGQCNRDTQCQSINTRHCYIYSCRVKYTYTLKS